MFVSGYWPDTFPGGVKLENRNVNIMKGTNSAFWSSHSLLQLELMQREHQGYLGHAENG